MILAQTRNYKEFDKISETGVDFYWATCVFFRKTAVNKIFFDLVKHILKTGNTITTYPNYTVHI